MPKNDKLYMVSEMQQYINALKKAKTLLHNDPSMSPKEAATAVKFGDNDHMLKELMKSVRIRDASMTSPETGIPEPMSKESVEETIFDLAEQGFSEDEITSVLAELFSEEELDEDKSREKTPRGDIPAKNMPKKVSENVDAYASWISNNKEKTGIWGGKVDTSSARLAKPAEATIEEPKTVHKERLDMRALVHSVKSMKLNEGRWGNRHQDDIPNVIDHYLVTGDAEQAVNSGKTLADNPHEPDTKHHKMWKDAWEWYKNNKKK